MNCDAARDSLVAAGEGTLGELAQRRFEAHLAACDDCRAAARAYAGLRALREQAAVEPPAGLFERVVRRSVEHEPPVTSGSRFWLGAGIGAAVAASLIVALLTAGVLPGIAPQTVPVAALQLSLGEPRNVNIAIDMLEDLPGAEISVVLSGGIELDGYAGRRELRWTTDLKAGTNRLTLPLVAVGEGGGRLLVRVGHGARERRFTLDVEAAT